MTSDASLREITSSVLRRPDQGAREISEISSGGRLVYQLIDNLSTMMLFAATLRNLLDGKVEREITERLLDLAHRNNEIGNELRQRLDPPAPAP